MKTAPPAGWAEAPRGTCIRIILMDAGKSLKSMRNIMQGICMDKWRRENLINETLLTIQDVETEERDALFAAIRSYFQTEELGLDDEESMKYFMSSEYRREIERVMDREVHSVRAVWFVYGGQRIGFSTYCVFNFEDGKLFILELSVNKEYQRQGLGRQYYQLIEQRESKHGAKYSELTANKASGFWKGLGFVHVGIGENGEQLFQKKI